MKKVLSTKALDAETMAYAAGLNMDIQCLDFIEISPVEFKQELDRNTEYDAVAFTSVNAVKYFFEYDRAADFLKGKRIFCIKENTLNELLKHDVKSHASANNAAELAGLAIQAQVKSLIHFCGNLKLGTLAEKLKNAGIGYTPMEVYKTGLVSGAALDKEFDAVMFYSPSGVESFFTANKMNDKTIYCCIGETTVAKAKAGNPAVNTIIAIEASPKSMIEAISKCFQAKDPSAGKAGI